MNVWWSMCRCEYWRYKKLFWAAPMVLAALLVAVTLLGAFAGDSAILMINARLVNPVGAAEMTNILAYMINLPFWVLCLFMMAYYGLHSFFAERQAAEYWFWRTLPVGSFEWLGSRVFTVMITLPLCHFLMMILTQAMIFFLLHLIFIFEGVHGMSWHLGAFILNLGTLCVSWALQGIWLLPFAAWLLFSSLWAKSSPLLFALVPPFVVMALEETLLGRSHLYDMLTRLLSGAMTVWSPSESYAMYHQQRKEGIYEHLSIIHPQWSALAEHITHTWALGTGWVIAILLFALMINRRLSSSDRLVVTG